MEEIQDLFTFLEETYKEIRQKIETVDEALDGMKSDDEGLEKMLEKTMCMAEGLNESMNTFKSSLVEKQFIKSSVPQIILNLLGEDGPRKRDSGIASSISSASPQTSSCRLSGVDDFGSESKVSFNLLSTHASLSDFGEKEEDVEETEPAVNQSELSTLYIHLLPTDPDADLSALKEKIYNLSRATMKSDNVQLHVVPSDSFIGIHSRQTSISSDGITSILRQSSTSSERLNSGRHRLLSSNDSLTAVLFNNLSSKIPAEHSDLSDDNNSRLVSSSDSEISIARYRLQLNTIDTQTDNPTENHASPGFETERLTVATQTDNPTENHASPGFETDRQTVATQTD